jgi:hypothetical protein
MQRFYFSYHDESGTETISVVLIIKHSDDQTETDRKPVFHWTFKFSHGHKRDTHSFSDDAAVEEFKKWLIRMNVSEKSNCWHDTVDMVAELVKISGGPADKG